jgi:type IV pilus assembly protein PilA
MANIAVQPVVFLTGMSAAMAVPAFQKVRETSKQKTIMNNLRQIASGGQQFMLEEGVAKATYSDIVPEYVRPLIPVDGEDYTTLEVTSLGDGTLSVTTDSGKTVEYTY